jgi:hypothetical protein
MNPVVADNLTLESAFVTAGCERARPARASGPGARGRPAGARQYEGRAVLSACAPALCRRPEGRDRGSANTLPHVRWVARQEKGCAMNKRPRGAGAF